MTEKPTDELRVVTMTSTDPRAAFPHQSPRIEVPLRIQRKWIIERDGNCGSEWRNLETVNERNAQ